MNERVSALASQFIDLLNDLLDNIVKGIKGFTRLIYIPGHGLMDLGYVLLLVLTVAVIGLVCYIIKGATE